MVANAVLLHATLFPSKHPFFIKYRVSGSRYSFAGAPIAGATRNQKLEPRNHSVL